MILNITQLRIYQINKYLNVIMSTGRTVFCSATNHLCEESATSPKIIRAKHGCVRTYIHHFALRRRPEFIEGKAAAMLMC